LSKGIKLWHEEYPFRLEFNDDIPLVKSINGTKTSRLSPLTNLTLNLLTSSKIDSNFIICIPFNTLRPIPLISYILADRTQNSVLVFSINNHHHNNYYLLKIRYGSKFAYMDYPVAKIRNKDLLIEPYAPKATHAFKRKIKEQIPYLLQKFLNTKQPKVLFYQNKDLKLISKMENIRYFNDLISNSHVNLNIKNIIFENIDFVIYNQYRYENFLKWINTCMDENNRYIFHISNPNYKLLNLLKEDFEANVLYFPYSFLKTNENLNKKNKEYFPEISKSKFYNAISKINLDNFQLYQKTEDTAFQIQPALIKGNLDSFFAKGMNLFKKIEWQDIQKELSPLIFKLKQLFFNAYKIVTIPSDFQVRYLDNEIGWRFYHIDRYLRNVLRTIKSSCISPNLEILTDIVLFLSKMVNELTECKRYGEDLSYSRIGKYYSLFDLLKHLNGEKIVIGVQTGEKSNTIDKLKRHDFNGDIRVYTFKHLARMVSDFSSYILLLPGPLLPSHFQILFKNWKKVQFIVYNGNNAKWVKDQIELIEKVDITKEEQSILYLAEVYKNLEGIRNYSVENDEMFKNFIKKKRILLDSELAQDQPETTTNITQILAYETKFKSVSITDLCRKFMKEDDKFREILIEEKTKSIVNKKQEEYAQRFYEETKGIDCSAQLENLNSGEKLIIPLDYHKKYMFFKNKDQIKVENGFPHAIPKNSFLILFGRDEKLSMSEFLKQAFEFEYDIDYDLIDEWQERLQSFYLNNYTTYMEFFKDFDRNFPKSISYNEFKNWVKGYVNYTKDPKHLFKLGELMNDPFFMDNYHLINQEGRKVQIFNMKLSRKLKKLIIQILGGNISWNTCSEEERLLLEKIENCIFKVENINIKSE